MKNAIIVHGLPSKRSTLTPSIPNESNSHWLPWLQKQLIVKDYRADTPEMPQAYAPEYDVWAREVEHYEIGQKTTLVGHSCGGGFWVRYLSEHPGLKVDKVVLVAPWVNVNHEEDITFFDFEVNPDITKQAKEFVIFSSDNDHANVRNSIAYLKKKLPGAKFREFHKHGHFCIEDMKTNAFPELLEEIL